MEYRRLICPKKPLPGGLSMHTFETIGSSLNLCSTLRWAKRLFDPPPHSQTPGQPTRSLALIIGALPLRALLALAHLVGPAPGDRKDG